MARGGDAHHASKCMLGFIAPYLTLKIFRASKSIQEDRKIKAHEWARFQHHAKRVRELSITLDRTERDKPLFVYYDCYDYFIDHYKEGNILPNLRKITTEVGRVEYFLPTLLQPALRSFTWTYGDEEDAVTLLQTLVETVPSLRELSMREQYRERATPEVYQELWDTVCALNELRSLSISALSPDALQHTVRDDV